MPVDRHCRHCAGNCSGDCLLPGDSGLCIHRPLPRLPLRVRLAADRTPVVLAPAAVGSRSPRRYRLRAAASGLSRPCRAAATSRPPRPALSSSVHRSRTASTSGNGRSAASSASRMSFSAHCSENSGESSPASILRVLTSATGADRFPSARKSSTSWDATPSEPASAMTSAAPSTRVTSQVFMTSLSRVPAPASPQPLGALAERGEHRVQPRPGCLRPGRQDEQVPGLGGRLGPGHRRVHEGHVGPFLADPGVQVVGGRDADRAHLGPTPHPAVARPACPGRTRHR